MWQLLFFVACHYKKQSWSNGKKNHSTHYRSSEIVLQYIRDIDPGDVKEEIREDVYLVSLKTFCVALQMERL